MSNKNLRQVIFLFIFLLIPAICFAISLEGISSLIHSPQELAGWLLHEFRYEWEMPDYWQSPEETLHLRKGDCEDFAILAWTILTRLNIPSHILIIKFKDLNQSHAVCIFKNDESYAFISNQELIQTKASSIKEAIQQIYPDWDKIIFTNAKREYAKIMNRGKPEKGFKEESITSLKNK